MKLRFVVSRVALIVAVPLAASCVPQREFEQQSEDLASAQSAIKALETEVESLSTELEQTTSELSKAESQVDELESNLAETESKNEELQLEVEDQKVRNEKAKAQFEVIRSIFAPTLTGEAFTISKSESVTLFRDRIDKTEATKDVEFRARFDAFIDSGFSEEQRVDFFIYLIEGASDTLAATINPTIRTVNCRLRSIDGSVKTFITFTNLSGRTVPVNWLDYAGNEVLYEELAPGSSYDQPTWITHPWCVRDKNYGEARLSVTATAEHQTIVVP